MVVDIGLGKSARKSFGLDELMLVPGKRTLDPDLVDISWQLDAYHFDLPFMTSAMDSVTNPQVVSEVSKFGGLGVLDLEGLWTRHADVDVLFEELKSLNATDALLRLKKLYDSPVDPDLLLERVSDIQTKGGLTAGAVSPKTVMSIKETLIKANLDLLLIRGTVISAEHIVESDSESVLNLKKFVRELETPVIVGGCVSYQAALHLMRTGAAGVLVGVDSGCSATNKQVTGIGTGMASAIADIRAARMRHLDETGVYVHIIADGGFSNSAQVVKALACGADSVMLGSMLAASNTAPAFGWHWGSSALHHSLPQGNLIRIDSIGSLEQILLGPAGNSDGHLNIFGALRRAMATLGFKSVKELQKADLVVIED